MEAIIDKLSDTLSNLNVQSLLENGNVEKQLKFLMASNYDSKPNWYLMDKKFSKHEIDLVFFDGHMAKFVAELKCTFAWDSKRIDRDIADAIVKAERTKFMAFNQNEESWVNIKNNAKQYILHFLLVSDPRSNEKPDWVNRKYHVPFGYNIVNSVKFIKEKYQKCFPGVEHQVKHFEILPSILDAILVEIA